MMRWVRLWVVTLAFLGVVGPAWAWGPKTRVAVVTTAARILSKESGANLARLERDIRNGASISPEELQELIPLAAANPVAAIESEMYLLQAVQSNRVDPYYAYRLGVLGSLVADATAPLADADPTYRNLYYADVEAAIDSVQIRPSKRAQVEPAAYFAERQRAANQRAELMISDYRSGVGFKGVAGTAISEDASRSVSAVADVMQAVLLGRVVAANISPTQIRDYVVRAIDFYIDRGNDAETESAYRRLIELGVATVDLQKRIGDMFYDAGRFPRAMQEYQAVLAAEPGRRDVIERISAYYVRVGDDELAANDLEGAVEAYRTALEADRLHPSAQQKLLDAQRLVRERDDRLAAMREALARAEEKVTEAERSAFRKDYGTAISQLYEAQRLYGSVTDEFAVEQRLANNGLVLVESKLDQLRGDLVSNAPSLSGLGSGMAIKQQAAAAADAVNEEALRALVQAQYKTELDKLRSQESAGASN